MDTLKLHDLETSSIFWELRFLMTEKDIVNLLRIVTSWFDLTRTDIGRKALEIDCPEMFKESLLFSKHLRERLHDELIAIVNRKRNLQKEHFTRFEMKRKIFEFNEQEKANAAEENRLQFISTFCQNTKRERIKPTPEDDILYNISKQNEIIEKQITNLKEKELSELKRIRLEDAKMFSMNGIMLSKDEFLKEFKNATDTNPEDEKLLKVWQHSDNSSFFNFNGFLFVISY